MCNIIHISTVVVYKLEPVKDSSSVKGNKLSLSFIWKACLFYMVAVLLTNGLNLFGWIEILNDLLYYI